MSTERNCMPYGRKVQRKLKVSAWTLVDSSVLWLLSWKVIRLNFLVAFFDCMLTLVCTRVNLQIDIPAFCGGVMANGGRSSTGDSHITQQPDVDFMISTDKYIYLAV